MKKIKFEKLSQDEMKMISGGADPLQPELGGVYASLWQHLHSSRENAPLRVYIHLGTMLVLAK